ncbi:MAG: hypothetical protein V4596_11310 [Bdellovibrionota bacterium]
MKNSLSLFIFTLLVSTAAFGQVVIIGGGSTSEPPNMSTMLEYKDAFSKAQPVTADDLALGKSWDCTSYHYYRPTETDVGFLSFNNLVNNEVEQTGTGNAKKYTFTEKGLVASHAYEGWNYEYLDGVRKTDNGLIIERSINPAAQPYQFASVTDTNFYAWTYFTCSLSQSL